MAPMAPRSMAPSMILFALFPAAAVASTPLLQQSRIVSLQLSAPAHDKASELCRLRGGAEYSVQTQTLADMAGTFFLLMAVRLSAKVPEKFTSPVQMPVLGTLGTLIFLLGPISGAYFNPVVNFASLVTGEMSLNKFLAFTLVQFIAAGVCAKLVQTLAP